MIFILCVLQIANYKIFKYQIKNTKIYNYTNIFITYSVLFEYTWSDFTSLIFQKLEDVEDVEVCCWWIEWTSNPNLAINFWNNKISSAVTICYIFHFIKHLPLSNIITNKKQNITKLKREKLYTHLKQEERRCSIIN